MSQFICGQRQSNITLVKSQGTADNTSHLTEKMHDPPLLGPAQKRKDILTERQLRTAEWSGVNLQLIPNLSCPCRVGTV
ncbi:hypothetical protein RRG08_023815 [Elysia crispata]|uniref:Uncharacterized protein n=1 Tax=Elysia crispata TaxID=231223 RepID=A0AAE0ZW53_9GAST|nr:hypothetical protein RRG08_023815 [Elysia crispata]